MRLPPRAPLYLLQARVAAARNTILSRRHLGATLMWTGVVVATLVGLYFLSVRLLTKVDQVDQLSTVLSTIQAVGSLFSDRVPTIGEMLNRTILMMFLFSLTVMLLVSNVISALSTFFASEELELIFASPLPYRTIFFSKFVETAIHSSWMVFLVLLPFLAGFGRVYRAGPIYYFTFWIPLVPFVTYSTCAGVLVTLFLAKAFPLNRTRNLLRFLAVLGAGLLLLIFRVMRPELLVAPDHFRDFLATLSTPWNPYLEQLPSGWAAKEVLWLLGFPLGATPVDHVALWVGALALMGLTYWCAARVHLSSWQDHAEGSSEAAGGASSPDLAGEDGYAPGESSLDRALGLLSVSGRALLAKDARVFCRSPVIWTQVMLMIVIMVIYLYNIHLLPLKTIHGITTIFIEWLAFLNIGFVSFVVVALALRFGFPTVSMEGPGFYLIHSSPLGVDRYVRLKFWSNYLPLSVISLILVVASNRLLGVHGWVAYLAIVDAVCLSALISSWALAFGAQYHDFRRQSLSEIPSSFGGMVFMVSTLAAVCLILGLQAVPFWYYTTDLALSISRASAWHWWLGIGCGVTSVGLCLVLSRLALAWGQRSLAYLEVC